MQKIKRISQSYFHSLRKKNTLKNVLRLQTPKTSTAHIPWSWWIEWKVRLKSTAVRTNGIFGHVRAKVIRWKIRKLRPCTHECQRVPFLLHLRRNTIRDTRKMHLRVYLGSWWCRDEDDNVLLQNFTLCTQPRSVQRSPAMASWNIPMPFAQVSGEPRSRSAYDGADINPYTSDYFTDCAITAVPSLIQWVQWPLSREYNEDRNSPSKPPSYDFQL